MSRVPPRVTAQVHAGNDDGRLVLSRQLNHRDWDVPNRTKVVRLIVVLEDLNLKDNNAVGALARKHHATRADVFIIKTRAGKWEPHSWLGSAGLVPHHRAHHAHPETVVILMVEDREQLQWECNVPFRISQIRKAKAIPDFQFNVNPKSPKTPFRPDLTKAQGWPGQPIVSGAPTLKENQCDQLYKASFELWIPGETGLTEIDPDIYCDWN